LTILAEHPEISQKDLQEILRIEPGSMSELVIKLEHKGFITRTKDETDKRMSKLMITELGLELSKELGETDTHEEQLLLSSLDSEEQQQLKVLLSKLLAGWESSYEAFREDRHHKECDHHDHCGHHHGHHKLHGHHGHHSHQEQDHREHHKHHDYKDKDAHHEHHDHKDKDAHHEHHHHR
jgi:DNA-binding MarR family transcriptional regulator